jgi:FKBP-type peptidyl-prolyl cis-trans isomerase FkpA
MKKLNLLWLVLPILILSACDSNQYKDQMHEAPANQEEIDQNAIINYLTTNKIDAKRTESGIYYTITKEGDGKNPTAADVVNVHYKGMLLDTTVFDSSYDRGEPIEFPLKSVIPGWTEGITLLKEGGAGTLYIPSGLAYGANPRPGGKIKPNDPLIFDVELLSIISGEEYIASQEKVFRDRVTQFIGPGKEKLDALKTDDGVYYVIEEAGSEEKPNITSNVTVHYTGKLLDGTKFDSSVDRGTPATFSLQGVVPGWTFGIPKFGKGGKGTLLIPSYLAYGERGSGEQIPPNSCLVFDVEVIDFQ